jgi:hypothetical protein
MAKSFNLTDQVQGMQKELQEGTKSVLADRKKLLFLNEKLEQKDPFSAKSLRAAKIALDQWNKSSEKRTALTARQLELQTKLGNMLEREKNLVKRAGPNSPTYFRNNINNLQAAYNSIKGYSGVKGSIAEGDRAAANVQGAIDNQPGRASSLMGVAGGFIKGVVMDAVYDTVKAGIGQGWSSAGASRSMALMSRPGEFGGHYLNKKTGKIEPYGTATLGTSTQMDAMRNLSGPGGYGWMGALGYTGADLASKQNELYSISGLHDTGNNFSGITAGAKALMAQSMGAPSNSIAGLASMMGQGMSYKQGAKNGGFSTELEEIMKKGVQLGIGGSKGQFIDSIINLTAAAQQTALNTDPLRSGSVIAKINAIGNSGNGVAGLQNAAGGSIAARIQNSLLNPGGGTAGQLWMMRATGFGSKGKANLFDYHVALEQGLNEGLLDNMIKYAGGRKASKGSIASFATATGIPWGLAQAIITRKATYTDPVTGNVLNEAGMKGKLRESVASQGMSDAEMLAKEAQNAISTFTTAVINFAGAVDNFTHFGLGGGGVSSIATDNSAILRHGALDPGTGVKGHPLTIGKNGDVRSWNPASRKWVDTGLKPYSVRPEDSEFGASF